MSQSVGGPPEQTLAERYHRSSPGGRRAGIAAAIVGLAAVVAWVVWAGLGSSKDGLDAQVQSYRVTSPHAISVTVEISRTNGDAVRCVVSAIATDHSTVGESMVAAPKGHSGTVVLRTVVKTERRATTAAVGHCH